MKADQLLKSSLTVSLRLLPPPEVLERRHINGQPSSLDLHSHKHDQYSRSSKHLFSQQPLVESTLTVGSKNLRESGQVVWEKAEDKVRT